MREFLQLKNIHNRLNLLSVFSVVCADRCCLSFSSHFAFSGSGDRWTFAALSTMFPHLFSPTGNLSVNYAVCSYEKLGHEELLLWTSSPHPDFWHRISIFPYAAVTECGWFLAWAPGSSLTSSRRGVIVSVLDHCISMQCLSLLYFTAYQLIIYHLILFLLVKSVANTSDLLGFYLWFFFLFLLPYSFLPSQKWSGSAHYVFFLFVSFPSSAVFFWVVPICSFFFWCFCPAIVLIM